MKKKFIGMGIVAGALAAVLITVPILKSTKAVDVYGFDGTNINYPTKDVTKELGSAENPFLIMELVPSKDMATLGYLIPGQGTVSESAIAGEMAASENDASAIYNRLFASNTDTTSTISYRDKTHGDDSTVAKSAASSQKVFWDDSDQTNTTSKTENFSGGKSVPDFAQMGYFEKVDAGKGLYKLTNENGVYKFVRVTESDKNDGAYNWHAVGEYNIHTGDGNGNYVFTKQSVFSDYPNSDADGHYKEDNGKKIYFDGNSEYTVPIAGVHVYSKSDGTETAYDRTGNVLTKNSDGAYSREIKDSSGNSKGTIYYSKTGDTFSATFTPSGGNPTPIAITLNDDGSFTYIINSVTYTVSKDGTVTTNSGTGSGSGNTSGGAKTTSESKTTPAGNAKQNNLIIENEEEDETVNTTEKSETKKSNTETTVETKTTETEKSETKTPDPLDSLTTSFKSTIKSIKATFTASNAATGTDTKSAETETKEASSDKSTVETNNINTEGKSATGEGSAATTNAENSTTGNGAVTENGAANNGALENGVTAETNKSGIEANTNSSGIELAPGAKANKLPAKAPAKAPTNGNQTGTYTSDNIELGRDAFTSYTEGNAYSYDYKWLGTGHSDTDQIPACGTADNLAALGTAAVGTTYYTVRFDQFYTDAYAYLITNNDTLARKILGKGSYSETNPDGAHIEVIAVTPYMLNHAENFASFIQASDMIVIHDMVDARLVEKSNDYNADLDANGKKGYHYSLYTSENNSTTGKFYGDDAAGLLEAAENAINPLTSGALQVEDEHLRDANTNSDSVTKTATRDYFTHDNDIDDDVLAELVKRQAGNNPAAMVLDSSAIYKDSTTTLFSGTTTEEKSNYHDGVPAKVGLALNPEGGIADVSCGHPELHKDLHSDPESPAHQIRTRKYSFTFSNNAIPGNNNGGISPQQITIYLPKYIFIDEYGNQGFLSTIRSFHQETIGDSNVLTLDIRNKKNNDSFFQGYTKIGETTRRTGELYLCSSYEDKDKLENFDITKCPVYMTVTPDSGSTVINVQANQDVAENLNELYVIMNYYGAKYYWNLFCVDRDQNGKVKTAADGTTPSFTIPKWFDPSIVGASDSSDFAHTYPTSKQIYDALVPLTKSTTAYDFNNTASAATPSGDGQATGDGSTTDTTARSSAHNTHLSQGSYGNGIGKSPFVWDFDGQRSAFSTAFNMSNYTVAAANADGTAGDLSTTDAATNTTTTANPTTNAAAAVAYSVGTGNTIAPDATGAYKDAAGNTPAISATKDQGITRPSYMDSTTATDNTNLSEVFDQRFVKDAEGNVIGTDGQIFNKSVNASQVAALQTSITRPDMLSFIYKESEGYNGTTGDKYKTSLKILEVEPTDEFIYGSYYIPESKDEGSQPISSDYYSAKYNNKMNVGGINMKTNVDWYSNFEALKQGNTVIFPFTSSRKTIYSSKGNVRYYYDSGNGQQLDHNNLKGLNAKTYIKYDAPAWKDWKEYFYGMIPGFIGTDANGDLAKDVEITAMPIWKFNAVNIDINSEYDIVVVGAAQNYKNGQLKRIYSYNNNSSSLYVDGHMANASSRNRVTYRRWICYNDPNLESYDINSLGPNDNVGTPPSHDTMGDPAYALAWTAVGDYVDTSIGNSSMNEGWYYSNTKNENTPYAYSGNVVINTSASAWITTRFTIRPTSDFTTIKSTGGSDASQAGTRYEARDFTKKKAEALLDFADRNLLVIDDSVYSNGSVDGNLIDSRSEMYYLANTYFSGQKNISLPSSINDNKTLFNVRKNTLLTQCDFSTDDVVDAKWPVDYSYSDNPKNATSNTQKVNGDDGLIFTVSVNGRKYNNDGTLKTYYINVYNDVNNNSVYDGSLSEQRKTLSFAYNDENKNGIYDTGDTQPVSVNTGTDEKLAAVSIYDITDSNNKTEISSTQKYPFNAIYAGRKYSVEAAISDDYFGALGYKFEISEGHIDDISNGMSSDDRNASLRKERTGLTRFKQAGKKIIHILQINPVADMRNNAPNNTMAFYEMQAFKNQMANVPDFYVEIDFLKNNSAYGFYDHDKGKWVKGSFTQGDVTLTPSLNSSTNGCVAEKWPIVTSKDGDYKFTMHDLTDFSLLLENYDMVFLAGRDSAMVSNDPIFIKAMDKYSSQGGSIIMSHDMVSSFFNVHSISSADNRFSAWNRQMMLQIYYLQKLQGQVEKYYTPGTTNYSYNTMYASSNTSRNREKSVMMPLEATFALALNQSNAYSGIVLNDAAIANDVRFADQYDFTNSSEYLDKVVDDTLATGNLRYRNPDPYTGRYNDSADNNRAIMTRDSYNKADLRFDKKYPAGWQSSDSVKYIDGSNGQTEGEYAKYFASLVTNNDLYNLEHYVTTNVNQNLIEDVNSFGLCGWNRGTDLTIKNWGWVPTTDSIQNVNKGKVSSYPFDMSKDETNGLVSVTSTHMQQYRLDLDHTNDPAPTIDGKMSNITDDTIVWYDLANSNGNYLYNLQKGDSANNYYIYTKGNITYTGVGHASVSKASEIRLFINTMIASYRPAEGTPYIKVTNRDARTSGNTTTVYFDESTGDNGIITFQVMDPTLANIKRDYYLKIYEVNPDGTERLATDGTITENPSAEHVLNVYKGNTLTNAVDQENDGTKVRHLRELQNAPIKDTDGTNINKLDSSEYGFLYKVQKGGRYCFQGTAGKKYCIHLCYRNYKSNPTNANKKVDYGIFKEVRHYVKLQHLDYFDLY